MEGNARQKAVFFARLAEQAERYDEMAEHMHNVSVAPEELSAEERRLLSVAYSNTVAKRRAARRSISSIEREENTRGNNKQARFAREYCAKVEGELGRICESADQLLSGKLSGAKTHEETVFYQKMKADNFRHVAEFTSDKAKAVATESAEKTYEEASSIAQGALPAAHPVRFGLALNYSVFQSEVLGKPEEACRRAPTALRNTGSWAAVGGGISPRLGTAETQTASEQHADDNTNSSTSLSVVAQRLCDLLLEFPEASIGGVRWNTLMRTYAEIHQTDIDIASLGYMSPSAAAKALLSDVLRQKRGDGHGHCDVEELDNPLVAVEDSVAMTPLPGFASSWPALYHTLCMMVQKFGSVADLPRELDAAGVPRKPAHILLLSQLRPLLEKSQEEDVPGTAAGPVRGLLLSQLRPVSQLWHASSGDNGLSFRDDEGNLRKLQKMGHLVKAVLRWRDQRVKWRHEKCGGKPSLVDEALSSRLELVFSKEYNNLVLCLIDKDDYDDSKHAQSLQGDSGSAASDMERSGGKSNQQRFENPFKWSTLPAPRMPNDDKKDLQLAHSSIQSGICGGLLTRSSSSPGLFRVAAEPLLPVAMVNRSAAESLNGAAQDAARHGQASDDCWEKPCAKESEAAVEKEIQHYQPTAEKLEAMAAANQLKCCDESPRCSRRWDRKSSPLGLGGLRASPHRSPSAGARASSCQEPNCRGRSRSLAREAAQVDNARPAVQVDFVERSTSEPPRPRWADLTDDPFEIDAPYVFWTSFVPLDEASTAAANSINLGGASSCESECWSPASYTPPGLTAAGERLDPASLLATAAAKVAMEGRITDQESCHRKRWASPVQLDRTSTDAERAPGCGGRALSCSGRARSLTRVRGSAFWRDTTSPLVQTEVAEPRSTSEPPQQSCADVFDDPFEPPPQEMQWVLPRSSLDGVKSIPSAPHAPWNCGAETSGRVNLPVVPVLICNSLPMDLTSQASGHSQAGDYNIFQQKRWASPRQRSSEPMNIWTRRSPSCGVRVANGAGRGLESAEPRSTSEPPHMAVQDVFDDPFEPPPQQMWVSCLAPAPATTSTSSHESAPSSCPVVDARASASAHAKAFPAKLCL